MIRYKRCSYPPKLSFSQTYKTLFLSNSSLQNSTATDSIAAPQPASNTISRPLALRHRRATTIVITVNHHRRHLLKNAIRGPPPAKTIIAVITLCIRLYSALAKISRALDEKQNEAIEVAANELAGRKGVLDENLKLPHELKIQWKLGISEFFLRVSLVTEHLKYEKFIPQKISPLIPTDGTDTKIVKAIRREEEECIKRNKAVNDWGDHMYRMTLMAVIASDTPRINRDKLGFSSRMNNLYHALLESIQTAERLLWLNLISFPSSSRCIKMAIVHDIAEAEEIYELWMEYEENSTNEAKVVKDFDKIEMILQALEYEKEQGKDLEEFFQSTAVTSIAKVAMFRVPDRAYPIAVQSRTEHIGNMNWIVTFSDL
ncbi:hypothetical protein L2E82_23091 [Cichorium intybus]|uniref:Uncharacterized protein n=1 Tax=Cichorium intybus TaxID=13427 RepID=A0ACB9E006_CICIN|nr:hypothetical protein L2E82_23091 [Cichorium intybus]